MTASTISGIGAIHQNWQFYKTLRCSCLQSTALQSLYISASIHTVLWNIYGSQHTWLPAVQTSKPLNLCSVLKVTALQLVFLPQNEVKISWCKIRRVVIEKHHINVLGKLLLHKQLGHYHTEAPSFWQPKFQDTSQMPPRDKQAPPCSSPCWLQHPHEYTHDAKCPASQNTFQYHLPFWANLLELCGSQQQWWLTHRRLSLLWISYRKC